MICDNIDKCSEIRNLRCQIDGYNSVFRLKEIDIAKAQKEVWRLSRELASVQLEIAELRLLLAHRASEQGVDAMPLNALAAERYFKRLDKEKENDL